MIKFDDFFKIEDKNSIKVKFNMNNANVLERALDFLLDDNPKWIDMNAWKTKQSNNNFGNAKYVLSFAQYYPYGSDFYLFGGMYKIEKIIPEVYDDIGYKLTLVDDYKEYRKRLIIKIEKPIGRDVYNKKYSSVVDDLNAEIYEILPDSKLGDFPGYNNVLLKHEDLQRIYKMEAPEWKNSLSKVKGIYCITDTLTGKLYIGSASGNNGIWGRWKSYADINNLTGGNKSFIDIKGKDENYIIDNFIYSILEIMDIKTKDSDVIHREEFYKKVFQSVKFGMNN